MAGLGQCTEMWFGQVCELRAGHASVHALRDGVALITWRGNSGAGASVDLDWADDSEL
jgi:hypothetical protein